MRGVASDISAVYVGDVLEIRCFVLVMSLENRRLELIACPDSARVGFVTYVYELSQ
jgi:hypothetical protein